MTPQTLLKVASTLLPKIEVTQEDCPDKLLLMVEETKYPEFAARLNNAMADAGLSVTDIKNRIGVTYEMARRYTLGTAKPRDAKMKALAALFGRSSAWLSYGDEVRESANVEYMTRPEVFRIPVISYIQAGNWAEICDSYARGSGSETILTDLELSGSSFALRIKGKSMLPEFNEGDLVIIDPEVDPHPGDYVAAKNGEEEATFKKFRPRGTDENGKDVFELIPLNDDFPTLHSDRDGPMRIVGTMVEHRRFRRR